jgi:hypothetical protein
MKNSRYSSQLIYKTMTIGVGVCFYLLCLLGCATSEVAADKPSIEKLGQVGVFTWHGTPDYHHISPGGAIDNLSNAIMNIHSMSTGEIQNKKAEIQNSGVYDTFEGELAQKFSKVLHAKVQVLNKKNYVLSGPEGERRVDVLATAKAQGDDAVLETTVWPKLQKNDATLAEQNSLHINLKLLRVSDSKVLWMNSYTVNNYRYQDWNELAREAAARAIIIYNSNLK